MDARADQKRDEAIAKLKNLLPTVPEGQRKADLGDVARRAQRDLAQALSALGSRDVPVVAVSSVPPPSGIDELVEALKAAVAGETHEYTDMYPGMAKQARDEGFGEIADWFETLAKAERSHANRFQKALDALTD